MAFGHDTEDSLLSAAALVNTLTPEDSLENVGDLDEFVRSWAYTGAHTHTRAELDEVRALRPRFLEAWSMSRDDLVTFVNDVLLQNEALPQLVRHDGWDYHLHATPSDAPLASRIAVESVMAFIDVIRADEGSRISVCDDGTCEALALDLSRNRSKRYCDGGCGNRVAAAAYRSRRSD